MYSKRSFFSAVAILAVILTAGCKKTLENNNPRSMSPVVTEADSSIEGRARLVLGLAGNFAILSKSGITDVFPSVVTGDIGTSPITGAAIHLTCTEVSGRIFAVNAAGPSPCSIVSPSRLTTAVADMQTAYKKAAGLSNPDHLNMGAGNIGSIALKPGLYKWTTNLNILKDITLSGSETAVWIFQISGTMSMSSGVKVILKGGANPKNIYWQSAGKVTLGTTSHCEGTILGKTAISLKTGASINGRLLAQTAVTLEKSKVKRPT